MSGRFGTAVILAGGKSKRMGFDKQTLKIDGRYLILTLIEQMRPYFDQIIIACNRPLHPYHLYKGVTVVKDQYIQVGPMAGIHGALRVSNSDYVYVIACDTFFYPEVMLYFQQEVGRRIEVVNGPMPTMCICEKEDDYYEPLNAFYHKDLLVDFKRALRNNCFSLQKCIRTIDHKHVITAEKMGSLFKEQVFLNFNTKEEIKDYEKKHGLNDSKRA